MRNLLSKRIGLFVTGLATLFSLSVLAQDAWSPDASSSIISSTITGYLEFLDDVQLRMGTSADFACEYDTGQTPDSVICGVGSDSNAIIIAQKADMGTDFEFAEAGGAPALVIQSADSASIDERIYLYHNGTNGIISVGSGSLEITADVIFDGTLEFAEQLLATKDPDTTDSADASVLINPATSDEDDKFLAIQDNGSDVFTVDKEGEVTVGLKLTSPVVQAGALLAGAVSSGTATIGTLNDVEEINGFQGGGGSGFGLTIQVPDIGAGSDDTGVGIQILADDGGSNTTGGAGGPIVIKAGNAGGTGDNDGGSFSFNTGDFTGAGDRGYFSVADADNNRILLLTPVNGTGVNYVNITNAIASSGPTISTTGSDPNPDLNLVPQGSGSVVISPSLSLKNGSAVIISALNTSPDSYSGDLVQIQMNSNGGGTVTGSADAYRLIRGDITLTTGTQSGVFTTAHFQAQTSGSAISIGSGGNGIRALIASAIHNSTGTAESLVGLNSNCAAGENGSSTALGTINFCYGNRVTTGYVSGFSGTGAINNNYGVWISTPQNISAGRTIGVQASLFIDDATGTGITTGYSIYTGTGRVRFGGNLEFSNAVAADTTLYGMGRNADTPNALEYFVPTARIHKWTIAGGTEMTLSATAINFQDNALTTTGGGSLTGTWSNLGTVTTIDINGGTVDGTVIGGAAPAAASVTTLGMSNLITWTGGGTITAGSYQCGRNSDATNRHQCNVPAGAVHEFSVNDVEEYSWSSSDANWNNNTLSNIGGAGTDFTVGGSLIVGPGATASGAPAISINQAAHTAITNSQPALNVGNFSITINSGSTIATASGVEIGAPTFIGVAGGGAETVTDASSLRISGPAVQGANATVTNPLALLVDNGSSRFDGRVLTTQGADVASAGTVTLGNGNFFHITGTTTIDYITTTGWTNGSVVFLKFDGSVTVNYNTGGAPASTSNIQLSGAANFAATANDTLTLVLDGSGWREIARTVI